MHTPHDFRVSGIKTVMLLLLTIMVLASVSCTALKDPCRERRGMSGYGYKVSYK